MVPFSRQIRVRSQVFHRPETISRTRDRDPDDVHKVGKSLR